MQGRRCHMVSVTVMHSATQKLLLRLLCCIFLNGLLATDHCSSICHGRTCADLRHPPEGIPPVHCAALTYMGCNCHGCCYNESSISPFVVRQSSTEKYLSAKVHISSSEGAQRPCKPTEDGTSVRNCAKYCNPIFAGAHCPFCACAKCEFCSSSTALASAIAFVNRPPPPPPPPQPLDPVDQINRWWKSGKPSDAVAESGVLVRQFDALSKTGRAWEPCAAGLWCDQLAHIWPSTLINKNHNPNLYRGDNEAGLVLAPPPVNRFFCIYPRDGNSMGHLQGCQRQCTLPRDVFDCSFPPGQLRAALEVNEAAKGKYNEVVVDALHMKAQLPHSILGIFFASDFTREKAESIHRQFLEAYRMGAAQFPLLRLDRANGFSRVK